MNDISDGQVQSRVLRSYSALTVAGVMDYGPSRWPYDLVFMEGSIFFLAMHNKLCKIII